MQPLINFWTLPPAALSGPLRKDFLNRLSHELKLSSEQRERIERIVSEGQERTRELWRVERVETWHRIRKELTPEQQIRFEELFKSQPRDSRRPPPSSERFPTNPPSPAFNPTANP